jgi:hypothetical protein
MMRQFLRRKLGRVFLLPRRMLACSDGPPLILGSGDPRQVAPPDGPAVGAGDLTVIARGADAHFEIAAHAAEETSLSIDHRHPCR